MSGVFREFLVPLDQFTCFAETRAHSACVCSHVPHTRICPDGLQLACTISSSPTHSRSYSAHSRPVSLQGLGRCISNPSRPVRTPAGASAVAVEPHPECRPADR